MEIPRRNRDEIVKGLQEISHENIYMEIYRMKHRWVEKHSIIY